MRCWVIGAGTADGLQIVLIVVIMVGGRLSACFIIHGTQCFIVIFVTPGIAIKGRRGHDKQRRRESCDSWNRQFLNSQERDNGSFASGIGGGFLVLLDCSGLDIPCVGVSALVQLTGVDSCTNSILYP